MVLSENQKEWTAEGGKLRGQVVEIAEGGTWGELEITDDNQPQPNIVATYKGKLAGIQGLQQWADVDRSKELSHLATELQRRYVGYMQQKEYLAYLGFAVYATAASTILLFDEEKWPPPSWGSLSPWWALGAICVVWLLAFLYLRFELHRRRWAAMRLAGCERVLVKLATGDISTDASIPWTWNGVPRQKPPETRTPVGTRIGNFVCSLWGLFCPLKASFPVIRDKFAVYPKIFIDLWKVQQERPQPTDALKHERLVMLAGWGLFFLVLVNTWSRTPHSLQLEHVSSDFKHVAAVLGATETGLADLRGALSQMEAKLERLRSEKDTELQTVRSELQRKEAELQQKIADLRAALAKPPPPQ
jgi:hypothetical protein